jgi:hypothetical protein
MLRHMQPVFGSLAIFDVNGNAVPPANTSQPTPARHGENIEPTEFAVGATEPCVIFKGGACCRAPAEGLHKPFDIVRVNCGLPVQTDPGESGIFRPTPIYRYV